MTESPTPSKFAKWKRPLILGILSAIPATLLMSGLETYQFPWLGFVLIGFMVPALIFDGSLLTPIYLTNPKVFLLVILFWFLIGAILGYSTRKNWLAIGCWLLLDAIFIIIGFALCLFCQ